MEDNSGPIAHFYTCVPCDIRRVVCPCSLFSCIRLLRLKALMIFTSIGATPWWPSKACKSVPRPNAPLLRVPWRPPGGRRKETRACREVWLGVAHSAACVIGPGRKSHQWQACERDVVSQLESKEAPKSWSLALQDSLLTCLQ